MRFNMRLFLITILLSLCSFGVVVAQQGANRRVIHYKGDEGGPVAVGDTTAMKIVGNVKFYHNGAIITCDSAVRYTPDRFTFFDNVVINQNNSYIYGNRMEYDGESNVATVFAPIIKIVDEDAVLYTYNFAFNTLDNIGRYYGGGTLRQKDNYMESREGFYYADDRMVVGVGDVEMRNPDYKVKSDSVAYDMNTKVARFFSTVKKNHIWTTKGEIFTSKTGQYDNAQSTYTLRDEVYFYNGDDEMWADSVIYASEDDNLWLYNNIQIRNEKNLSYLFGDYGQYWGDPQNAMITRNPSAIMVDREKSDSIYFRGDSLFLFTFPSDIVLHTVSEPGQVLAEGEELITAPGIANMESGNDQAAQLLDSLTQSPAYAMPILDGDTGSSTSDSIPANLGQDSSDLPEKADISGVEKPSGQLTKQEQRELKALEKQKAKEAKQSERLDKQAKKDAEILERRKAKLQSAKGEVPDSVTADSIAVSATAELVLSDSLAAQIDSLPMDVAGPEGEKDSLQRVIKAYYNVKIFGKDMQAVCDSLVGFSADSTVHLYTKPILWSGANQITSEFIDIYSRNGELDRAFFTGNPLMSSEVEPEEKYNQVKGLTMEAFFRDNEIYRHNVNSNAQTLFYFQDDETGDYMGFLAVKSSDLTFLLDSMKIQDIIYRRQAEYEEYPVDEIPETQPTRLEGFTWQIERRPALIDVFSRNVRESELASYDSMPLPRFELTEAILKDRDEKIRIGVWVERNDRLTPETIEWIRDIDPNYGKDPEDEIRRGGAETMELPKESAVPADSLKKSSLAVADSITTAGTIRKEESPEPVADSAVIAVPVSGQKVNVAESVGDEKMREAGNDVETTVPEE